MDEFDAIARLFRPLARNHAGAFDLLDDAALLADPDGKGLVVTTDLIVEGTHFLPSDPPGSVARKLVRVNLSDLIAKGARPVAAFLTLAWPAGRDPAALEAFAAGLGDDLEHLCAGTPLLGGDTTATRGPLVAGLTLIGAPIRARPVLRRGAAPRDVICVTGSIGESGLGLAALEGRIRLLPDSLLPLRYREPEPPPLAFAALVAGRARASMDVSDGLIGDLAKLAGVSGVGVTLDLDQVPLGEEAAMWRDSRPDPVAGTLWLASAGDDYQTLMAVRPEEVQALQTEAAALGVSVTRIGVCRAGEGLSLRWDGTGVPLPEAGGAWRHQL